VEVMLEREREQLTLIFALQVRHEHWDRIKLEFKNEHFEH